MKIQYRTATDVLIVGMGGAGVKAAITAAESGAKVLLVGKFPFGHTGATFYPGTPGWGMQAVIHEGDTEEFFLEEILDAGAGAADPELAEILARGSTPAFRELESYGIRFQQYEDGRYKGVIPCFGKRLRGSSTLGIPTIRRILWQQLMTRGVTVRHGISVLALVKKDGAVVGALALDEQSELFYIAAKAVIMATGGGCGIYTYSLATPDETGDGYAMALDAGAALVNMEFIQFIPGLTWPLKKKLFQEKNLDTFPKFTNKNGEDVIRKYLPEQYTVEECLIERAKHGPFTTADISFFVDVGMYEEAMNGLALPSGGIHVQYDPKVLHDDRWTIVEWLKWMDSLGVKPVEEGFDMIPHAQCFNGGIAIDRTAGCGIPGLYAAGETAGGPHGADRLGGAAIAATQVFGKIAGENAARYAAAAVYAEVSDRELEQTLEARFDHGDGIVDIGEAMEEIRKIMWENGAVVRTHARCAAGIARLEELEKAFSPMRHLTEGADIRRAGELSSYLTLARALLTVMDARKESRGPHYRSDFPEKDPAFEGRIILKKDAAGFSTALKKA